MWYVQIKDVTYKYTVIKYKVHDTLLAITYNFTNLQFSYILSQKKQSHFPVFVSRQRKKKSYTNLCCSSPSVYILRKDWRWEELAICPGRITFLIKYLILTKTSEDFIISTMISAYQVYRFYCIFLDYIFEKFLTLQPLYVSHPFH